MSSVSVVIPAYNAARYVRGAVDSVLSQSHQEFEIIVIDDGSKDNTKQVVEPYLSDPRIRYLYQENRGVSAARNFAARVSNGEYLAFLDADDFFAPCALESMLGAFQCTKAAWLNVGMVRIIGDLRTVHRPALPAGDVRLAMLSHDFIVRSPIYPREEFFAIGMYDEEIHILEDWDIEIRMIMAGKRFAVVDEPLYHYTYTEGSLTKGNRRNVHTNTEKVLRKHHKRMADAGDTEIGRIYAEKMWALARCYLYEIHDSREAARCAWESLRYVPSLHRLVHPFINFFQAGNGQRGYFWRQ